MDNIKKIVIAGSGTMGSSMGEAFAKYGYKVVLYDIFDEALAKSEKLIKLNLETLLKEKVISREKHDEMLQNISFSKDKNTFADADFVVEAILENIKIKHEFWSEISNIVREDVVLCSNTSGLSISCIAEVINRPERFCGMHWINPPHLIPLIEIIKGDKTDDKSIKMVKDIAIELGKKPVVSKDAPGFILNRIQFAIMREALHIVKSGIADKNAVDDVMKYGLGMRYACLGPFQVADLGGLDIFYNIASYLFEDLADNKDVFGMLKDCKENNRLGVKSRAGFYDYSGGKDDEIIRYRDEMFTKISELLFE